MSRDYDRYCPVCKYSNAREILIDDSDDEISYYQLQCLNPSCGHNFLKKVRTEYIELTIMGITDKDWKKAEKEAIREKNSGDKDDN